MVKIKLKTHQGYEGNNLTKLKDSLAILEKTLNQNDFKDKVFNFKSDKTEGGTFHFIKYKRKFIFGRTKIRLKKYSNQEIYNKVIEGTSSDGVDSLIELNLVLKSGSGGDVVGYTKNKKIYTYTTDFLGMSKAKLAGHLFHEYTHLKGFSHSKSNKIDPLRDCFSVPYALGNIIEILIGGSNSRNCDYQF